MSSTALSKSSEVLQSGYISQGPEVDNFEKNLSKFFDNPNIITTNSATSAIHLVFHMLKNKQTNSTYEQINPGDHVLTTPLTCTATNWPILANGIDLKWVDVDKKTCNMNLDDLETKLTEKTKVVLIVHWGGTPIDLNRLKSIQDNFEKKYGFRFTVIEDCAHSFGSYYDNKLIGNHGNICIFSFQAIKHLTSVDGGCIIFPNKVETERARLLRWYGIDRTDKRKDFRCEENINEYGFKFHMNDVNASIGNENLSVVNDEVISKHKKNYNFYYEELNNVEKLELLSRDPLSDSASWIFTLKVQEKDNFMKKMLSLNIQTSRVHERNDHHTTVQQYRTDLPELDSFNDEIVCIPVGWWVDEEKANYIVDSIKSGW
tara:strand:- start:35579 stop:36700 length:1122 start_codon:yes stop_codon:yes gene_type:complete